MNRADEMNRGMSGVSALDAFAAAHPDRVAPAAPTG